MTQGMLREAKSLNKNGLSWKRMRELGLEYRFMALHLEGKINKKEMIEKLEKEIYQYAKRQMTWFKRDQSIIWFDASKKITLPKIS
jgi:tRNA dimethylallyltransferase